MQPLFIEYYMIYIINLGAQVPLLYFKITIYLYIGCLASIYVQFLEVEVDQNVLVLKQYCAILNCLCMPFRVQQNYHFPLNYETCWPIASQ